MRIAIEAERANIDNPTGVEHYAKQLIVALSKLDRTNSYILYLRSAPQDWIKALPENFSYKVIPFPIFWTQLRISWEVLMHPPDTLFIMASALPIIHPKNSIVTIHDLAWMYYPEAHGAFMRNYLRFSSWYACRFARTIIAVSEATKRDIIKEYGLPAEKIAVVHHGFDLAAEDAVSPADEQQKIANLPKKFVLALGTLQPRKNLIRLIDAFVALKKARGIEHSLVLAGGKGWLYDETTAKIAAHPEVQYFGYVRDRFALLRRADLLVQPALYEGFGLSMLDAFAVNVPVACSNVSSLPEVAGDAAEYFDPTDTADIARALGAVLTDPQRREQLVRAGAERLKQFSWEKCARETKAAIEKF